MDEVSVKCLLYADDQVILASSVCKLLEMINKPLIQFPHPKDGLVKPEGVSCTTIKTIRLRTINFVARRLLDKEL
ncbi:hypothetical protein EVAR_62320_1 [Eumeta japonica]|uniref:Reverse transcriptase domain-containing protein n=1 Tax=Eumeta variegata TaxID=151549 RepID=A0A4C1ZCK2_EUMVA|nr:hypothetical protein EVAR_62320_1 [Eumeta japonica]